MSQNNSRATDLGDILTSGTSGFTVRKTTGVGMFFHFFLLFCMVVLGAAFLVYYESVSGCLLTVAIGGAFALIAQNLERNKKMKQSLEFMNALFSSAIGKGYKFCFIVKNTGDIVFYNRPFQAAFPAYPLQDTRTLNQLLTMYTVSAEERDRIKQILQGKEDATLELTMKGNGDPEPRKYTIQMDSIERPTGFFIVRGK